MKHAKCGLPGCRWSTGPVGEEHAEKNAPTRGAFGKTGSGEDLLLAFFCLFSLNFDFRLGFFSGLGLCLRFGLILFHRLLSSLDAFRTDFRALLPLSFDELFAAEEFEERDFTAIALAETALNDAEIPALAAPKTGTDGVEQFVYGLARHHVRQRLAARGNISALGQSDHLFDVRTNRLGFCQ